MKKNIKNIKYDHNLPFFVETSKTFGWRQLSKKSLQARSICDD